MIAIGHHGTSRRAAEAILRDGFIASENRHDWLGSGVYFFQDGMCRALEWANKIHKNEATVLESTIEVINFIDLIDVGWASFLAEAHDIFLEHISSGSEPPPIQSGGRHDLDNGVINFAVQQLIREGYSVKGVRGAFQEGHSIFPNSALFDLSHIQIAVIDSSAITSTRMLSKTELDQCRKTSPQNLLGPRSGRSLRLAVEIAKNFEEI